MLEDPLPEWNFFIFLETSSGVVGSHLKHPLLPILENWILEPPPYGGLNPLSDSRDACLST